MINVPHEKPTLLVLRRQAHITSEVLATTAGVPLAHSYAVEIGGFCREETALKVLAAFNYLNHCSYSLADIQWQRPATWTTSLSHSARQILS